MPASNPFNVVVPTLDFSHPQAPTTQSCHGISIMANNQIVGRIEDWTVAGVYTRNLMAVRELNYRTFGRVIDIVPGINQEYTATASRFEVWFDEAEKAFGFAKVFTDLLDQTFPFAVKEVWLRGKTPYRISDYFGCWMAGKELTGMNATGDAIIKSNMTIHFVSKQITFGR